MELDNNQNEIYDLIFVGGGYQTLEFLISSIRQGTLYNLVQKSSIAIFEKNMNFGSSTYETQLINSTKNGLDLIRLILKDPEALKDTLFDKYITTLSDLDNNTFKETAHLSYNSKNKTQFKKEELFLPNEQIQNAHQKPVNNINFIDYNNQLLSPIPQKNNGPDILKKKQSQYQFQQNQQNFDYLEDDLKIEEEDDDSNSDQIINLSQSTIRKQSNQFQGVHIGLGLAVNKPQIQKRSTNFFKLQQGPDWNLLNQTEMLSPKQSLMVSHINNSNITRQSILNSTKIMQKQPDKRKSRYSMQQFSLQIEKTVKETDFFPQEKSYTERFNESVFVVDYQGILSKLDDLVLPVFKEAVKEPTIRDILSFGLKNPPMTLVSYYYRMLGVQVLQLIRTINKSAPVFFPSHEVLSYHLQQDGIMNVKIKLNIHSKELLHHMEYETLGKKPKLSVMHVYKTIKCKQVIFNQGGIPKGLPDKIRNYIPNQRYIDAYKFFTDAEYTSQLKKINKMQQAKKQKIIIIGGGNAAFLAAFLILQGPSIRTPKQFRLKIKKLGNSTSRKRDGLKQKCKCSCYCFGNLEPQSIGWKNADVNLLDVQPKQIMICHRSDIKLYFKNDDEQERFKKDLKLPKQKAGNEWGEINPKDGLRGDARYMYVQIKEGNEDRVKLCKYKKYQDLIPYLQDSCLVIEAMGRKQPELYIKDPNGRDIDLIHRDEKSYQVDSYNRVLTSKGSLQNFYGLGTTFSEQANNFLLYSNKAAQIIIKNINLQQKMMNQYIGSGHYWSWYASEEEDAKKEKENKQPSKTTSSGQVSLQNLQISKLYDQISMTSQSGSGDYGLDKMKQELQQQKAYLNFGKVENMIKRNRSQKYLKF
ncbi:hypothetical protein PPERSA_09591 [Pseudocohnilembus persalinus]|uniref:Uncharacterized protein n=1 Tax=Pseudocohnilembus persalinus TaxID=266149 RepID=A0A0V0QFK4_PSEPJ|nr:hypothetical protein PPERSA_09591 [Pseudocohnilembus persalinus]|eukprot:KRX00985.1 hypothetical protein PPERSA_09591 [Pseudocohnilembus persalinus]